MFILTSFLAISGQPAPPIFDQSLAAFRARKSFSVNITLDATLAKNRTKLGYKLSYQAPDRVLMTKIVGGQTNLIFWLSSTKFIAYDPSGGEMVVRKAPNKGPIVNRLANSIGGLEDPVTCQLSPDAMAAFVAPFKTLKGWTNTTSGGIIHLVRGHHANGKGTETDFDFSATTKLITRVQILSPSSSLLWDFGYGAAPSALSFSPPAGTKSVKFLSEHAHIDAADAKARNLVDRSLRAYGRISSLAFSVVSGTGASEDWVNGSSFREKRAGVDWSYTGGVFTLKDSIRGKSYRGRCKPSAVTTYLKQIKQPMDPVLQALFTHKNPIRSWFLPNMKVVSSGSLSLGGVTADAIEMRSPALDVSLLIRSDSHLVSSVTSRVKRNGKILSEGHREFTYTVVNKPMPASAFAVQVSKPLALARIPMIKR